MRTWWPGLLMVALALLLHLAGYMIQQPRLSVVAMFAGLYGIMGMAWGPALLRGAFFPFFLFAFCVPIGVLGQPITFPLRLLVTRLVESIAPMISIDVIREGTTLHDPTNKFAYEVAAACSGMRSLIATLALSLCYAWLSFPKWWKRAILIASAFPLAVLGNFLRMMAIVIAADIGGQPWGDYVHEGGPLGLISLLPYVPAFAGLILLGHWLRERTPEPTLQLAVKPT
jgi:exosortase